MIVAAFLALKLVQSRKTFKVPDRTLMAKCNTFTNNPVLLCAPYKERKPVSADDFRQFV
jgi:hypothetical protein